MITAESSISPGQSSELAQTVPVSHAVADIQAATHTLEEEILFFIEKWGIAGAREEFQRNKAHSQSIVAMHATIEREYLEGLESHFKGLFKADPSGRDATEELRRFTPADQNIVAGCVRRAQKALQRTSYGTKGNFRARHSFAEMFLRAIDAGCPNVEDLALWQIVGWSMYGRLPQPLVGKGGVFAPMVVTDERVPKCWHKAIAALPAGVEMYPVSYGPGAAKPSSNLAYLGKAYYGAIVVAGNHLPVPEREVVGVVLYTPTGTTVVKAGEGMGLVPHRGWSRVLEGVSSLPRGKEWDYPLSVAGTAERKARVDALCEKFEGQLDNWGV